MPIISIEVSGSFDDVRDALRRLLIAERRCTVWAPPGSLENVPGCLDETLEIEVNTVSRADAAQLVQSAANQADPERTTLKMIDRGFQRFQP